MSAFPSRWFIVLAVLALADVGCDDPTYACTLVGCEDGIVVRLGGIAPDEYTVTVSSPTAGTRSRNCSLAAPCGEAIRFDQYSPVEVTVTVEWQGRAFAATVRPAYTVWRPNGPDCPPECREAVITLQLGSATVPPNTRLELAGADK